MSTYVASGWSGTEEARVFSASVIERQSGRVLGHASCWLPFRDDEVAESSELLRIEAEVIEAAKRRAYDEAANDTVRLVRRG